MKFYKTTHNENAIRTLYERFGHVVVKPTNFLKNPTRMRGNLFADLPVYLRKEWLPDALSQEEKWRDNGGILLDYPNSGTEHIIETPAHHHIETPFSFEMLRKDLEGCKDVAVLYKPLTWQWHDNEWDDRNPHEDVLKRVCEALHSMRNRQLEARHKAACEVVGIPLQGVAVCTDREMSLSAQLLESKLHYIRRRIEADAVERKILQVVCLTPKVEPTDFVLRGFYNALVSMPDKYKGERMLLPRTLMEMEKNWRGCLRKLVREGNIHRGHAIYVYPLININTSWERSNLRRKAAFDSLQKVKDIVENAPDFN